MTKQITLEEALKLVSFINLGCLGWRVHDVKSDVKGNVHGSIGRNVYGDVDGDLDGNVHGRIAGDVHKEIAGDVWGTINGRKWKFVETPKDKLQRLIEESGNQELIDTFNQLEDNND